jgi:hypothetical protein
MTITQPSPVLTAELESVGSCTEAQLAIRLLDPAVKQLFAATLDLSSIAAASEAAIAERLLGVIDSVDLAIRQLRDDLIIHSGAHLALAS